jgi:hypothetical protein
MARNPSQAGLLDKAQGLNRCANAVGRGPATCRTLGFEDEAATWETRIAEEKNPE